MNKRVLAAILAAVMVLLNVASALPVFAEGEISRGEAEVIQASAKDNEGSLSDLVPVHGFYFESQEEADMWTTVDADGDGKNWTWIQDTNHANEGSGLMYSASFIQYVGALTPDNYLISPAIELNMECPLLSMYLKAWDSDYPAEHFAVYAGTSDDTSEMIEIIPETVVTASYAQYTADLAQFKGQTVYIAIRHFNCTNMYSLCLDSVEILGDPASLPYYTVSFVDSFTNEQISSIEVQMGTVLTDSDFPETPEHTYYAFTGWDYSGSRILSDTTVFALYEINTDSLTVTYGYYFESQDEADLWTTVDADGDGKNWTWIQDTNHANEGSGLMYSESYRSYVGALTPDNWLISPAIELSMECPVLSMFLKGWDASYVSEHFAVYAGTSDDTSEMIEIIPETVVTESYAQYTADLAQFKGQTVYIAIRHFNCTDMYRLCLDNVEILGDPASLPYYTVSFVDSFTNEQISSIEVQMGTVLTDSDFPEVPEHNFHSFTGWDYSGRRIVNDTTVFALYEINTDSMTVTYGYYFESQDEADLWTTVDADGDGNNWTWLQNGSYAYEGGGLMYSESYINYVGALTPDNWLISPAIELSMECPLLSMYLKAWDSVYPAEHFAVYAGTSDDPAEMVEIIPETEVAASYTQYTADLTQFKGQTVYIAIRHFNCTDMYSLCLDNVEILGALPPAVAGDRIEIRSRTSDDTSIDLRFRFNVTMNDSCVRYLGVDYGIIGGYSITELSVALQAEGYTNVINVVCNNIYSIDAANNSFVFAVVVTGLTGEQQNAVINATPTVTYSLDGENFTATCEPLSGCASQAPNDN